jgi:hypothetical protein
MLRSAVEGKLHRVRGDEEMCRDVGCRVSRDHFAADFAFPRCQAVRCQHQAQQMITGYRFDGDRNLIFVCTDQWTGLKKCPLPVYVAESGGEAARG